MIKNFISLAFQGATHKKRSSILVFFILLISFAFSIVSLSLIGSISQTNAAFRLNNYGEWYYGIPSGLNDDIYWLESQSWAEAIGTSQNYGSILTSAGNAGFGSLDSTLIDIGRIRLDDGRWPSSDNEIAIEARTLSLLGYDYTLGQEIVLPLSIPVGEKQIIVEQNYIVCGIIHEYTNLWSLNRNSDFRNLVSAVVTQIAAEEVHLTTKDRIPADSGVDPSLIAPVPQFFISVAPENREAALESLKTYLKDTRLQDFGDYLPCENKIAYPEMVETQHDTFYTYIIAIVSLLAVLCAYIIQLPSESKSYATLRSVGITKVQLACLLLTESFLLCVPAVLLGTPLGVGLTWLALRLLMYSGSVAIQVAIPHTALTLVILLWFAMVLFSRLLVLIITVHTPLVGRFQLQATKARRAKLFRNALILLLLISFGFVTVFTVLESLDPIRTRMWWSSCPSYVIWAESTVTQHSLDLIEQVPGVTNTDGFAEVEATLSFDDETDEIPIWVYAVDDKEWDITFNFGEDAELFRAGKLCILCLPDDTQTYLLPNKSITIRAKDSSQVSIAISKPTSFSVRRMSTNAINRLLAYYYEPYTVVVSHQYMKNLLASMETDVQWDKFIGGKDYGYDRVYVSVDLNAGDLSTDVVMAELCMRYNLTFSNRRQETMVHIQEQTQQLILLYTAGGSVALVLLMILISAISLETEQEKRHYCTLRVVGMSKRQMRADVLGKALGRAALSVTAGWATYLVVKVYDKTTESDSVIKKIQHIIFSLRVNGLTGTLVAQLSCVCFIVLLIVCVISKYKLKKGVNLL